MKVKRVYIEQVYNRNFGGIHTFKLEAEIKEIVSVYLKIDNLHAMFMEYGNIIPTHQNRFVNVLNYSLLLNNGNDEVISDITVNKYHPSEGVMFIISPFHTITVRGFEYTGFERKELVINKKVITNSVNKIVFKMPELLYDLKNESSEFNSFVDFVINNLKASLFIKYI